MDAGFGAAREHDVCVAEGDEARGVADGVGAGGAGGGDGVVGSLRGFSIGRGRIREFTGGDVLSSRTSWKYGRRLG